MQKLISIDDAATRIAAMGVIGGSPTFWRNVLMQSVMGTETPAGWPEAFEVAGKFYFTLGDIVGFIEGQRDSARQVAAVREHEASLRDAGQRWTREPRPMFGQRALMAPGRL